MQRILPANEGTPKIDTDKNQTNVSPRQVATTWEVNGVTDERILKDGYEFGRLDNEYRRLLKLISSNG